MQDLITVSSVLNKASLLQAQGRSRLCMAHLWIIMRSLIGLVDNCRYQTKTSV